MLFPFACTLQPTSSEPGHLVHDGCIITAQFLGGNHSEVDNTHRPGMKQSCRDFELGQSGQAVVSVGFWVMNGVGVALERVWKKVTGKRVGGVWGRTWMIGWLLLWSVLMANVYAKVYRCSGS